MRRIKIINKLGLLVSATLLLLGGVAGCSERSVGGNTNGAGDGSVHGDGSVDVDGGVLPDGGPTCNDPRLSMGFVLGTHIVPTNPEPSVDDYALAGTAAYHGDITVPLATNPAFNTEIQIQHGDGQVSILQYYLPAGLMLPVAVGNPYDIVFRERRGFEGYVVGLIIWRPTSGLSPLLFVGDTGTWGRAFEPEDPLIQPLKVYVEPRTECAPVPDPGCGGMLYQDRLRFDSSTGGVMTEVTVVQGRSATLPVFGFDHRVVNLASTHVDQQCPDDPGMLVSYLSVDVDSLPMDCDPSRFYFWDQPYGIEVGTFCDFIFFCVDNPQQALAAQQISPDLECGQTGYPECGPNGEACVWNPPDPVDAQLYDELCQVSVMADAPASINCRVFFHSGGS